MCEAQNKYRHSYTPVRTLTPVNVHEPLRKLGRHHIFGLMKIGRLPTIETTEINQLSYIQYLYHVNVPYF